LSNGREQIEARYSNHFEIGQNAFEFLFDFGQFYDEKEEQPRIHTRIITSPFYAKRFAHLLEESISRYEETNGAIPDADPEDGQRRDSGSS
jgi:hypothetical protein